MWRREGREWDRLRMASPLARASRQEYNKCRAAGELPTPQAKASIEFSVWSKAVLVRVVELSSRMGGRDRAPTAATAEDKPVGSVSAENFKGREGELYSREAARVGWARKASSREAVVVVDEKEARRERALSGSGKVGVGS